MISQNKLIEFLSNSSLVDLNLNGLYIYIKEYFTSKPKNDHSL